MVAHCAAPQLGSPSRNWRPAGQFGPVQGRAAFATSQGYQSALAASPSTAASLLSQFDKPLAQERSRRLVDLPRSVPYTSRAEVGLVTAPTLVVGARQDPTHPLEFAEELAHLIPGAELAVVAARDESPEQHRAELKLAIATFLRRLPPLGG